MAYSLAPCFCKWSSIGTRATHFPMKFDFLNISLKYNLFDYEGFWHPLKFCT